MPAPTHYAKLGPRKGVMNVIEASTRPDFDWTGFEPFTAEQAAAVTAFRADRKLPIFYNGNVTTVEHERTVNGVNIRWDEATGDFAVFTPPAPSRTVSKLAIRRQLREWGKEEAFDATLDAVPHARADWDDAQDIRTNDPLFVASKDALKAAVGLTDEQFDQLMLL